VCEEGVVLIVVCPFVLFLLAIVLSFLRFMDSDYPFGIFKVILIIAMLEYIYIYVFFMTVFGYLYPDRNNGN
jgi:hypothetical protein